MPSYPIELNLKERPVLVVGLGSVGRRKAAALAEAGAWVVALDPAWPEGEVLVVEGASGRVEIRREAYQEEHLAGKVLVVAAGPPEVNRRVVADAKQLGVLVGSASDPEEGDFTVPASWVSGPLRLTVSTSGGSPALAAALRDRAAAALGPAAADLARLFAELRPEVKRRVADPSSRRSLLTGWGDPHWLDFLTRNGIEATREALRRSLEAFSGSVGSLPGGFSPDLAGSTEPRHNLDQARVFQQRSRLVKVAVVGTGYVGLVQGTCLAESGNNVVCIDKDTAKIDGLNQGKIPIYEPGLTELVIRNARDGRLQFTTNLAEGIADAEIVFIAVGTPQGDDGGANLNGVWAVGREIAKALRGPKIITIKSTVPVGTNAELARRMAEETKVPFDVASNPEFLKEGAAIEDFNKPDRVVIGARREEVAEKLHALYEPFLRTDRPFLVMTPESAEMTKYVANCLLATKISFINEMANLCEAYGADVNDVRRGIGHDQRIGFHFLHPGVGYGGSCFPKDIRAVIHMAKSKGLKPLMMEAVDEVNEAQKDVLFRKINEHFKGDLAGKTIAIWGLAFKPKTDDIREAPALALIDALLAVGAHPRVHDPEAIPNVRAIYGDKLTYCDRPYGAIEQADALAIATEWHEFRNPDFEVMFRLLKQPVIFDGRNLYDPARITALGFVYQGIGRVTPPLPASE